MTLAKPKSVSHLKNDTALLGAWAYNNMLTDERGLRQRPSVSLLTFIPFELLP